MTDIAVAEEVYNPALEVEAAEDGPNHVEDNGDKRDDSESSSVISVPQRSNASQEEEEDVQIVLDTESVEKSATPGGAGRRPAVFSPTALQRARPQQGYATSYFCVEL